MHGASSLGGESPSWYNMSSSVQSNIQQLQDQFEHEEQRVKVLEYLLDRLRRESLSLVRQSEAACEHFSARIEELEEQVQDLTEQEEFFLVRLDYWRQRYNDLERSKQIAEQRLQDRVEWEIAKQTSYMITEPHLWNRIKDQESRIEFLERLFKDTSAVAESGGPQAAANGETESQDPTKIRHHTGSFTTIQSIGMTSL